MEQSLCEAELVRRAQAGDRAAFDRLAGRYRPALRAMAFLRTSDREAADDLTQETLARAWEALPTLRDPNAFLPWLKTVAARACLNWHRGQPARNRCRWSSAAETPDRNGLQPLPVLLERERGRALRRALANCPTPTGWPC